jgi:glycosyltransferase involved in cell wall biosynthesis
MENTILYFLDDPGRDKHFHQYVLTGLVDAGFNPIVTYFWTAPDRRSSLQEAGFEILDLGCSQKSYKGFHPSLVFKIARALKNHNAIGAHVQRHHPLIYLAIAARLTGLPVLFYTIRATKLIRNISRRFAFRLISAQIAQVIAVSQGVKQDFVRRTGLAADRVVVIHNGIDPGSFERRSPKTDARAAFNLPKEKFLFGMAARFKKAKDHSGLIKAFSMVRREMGNACLVLAGDGPLKNEILKAVADLDLREDVIFLGQIAPKDMPLLLHGLDVFIHPSWREGMPAAILEAMASGLPVIATDAEGVTDIFAGGLDFGRMVPRGNTERLAQAMLEIYQKPPEALMNMGRGAKTRVKEAFTHERMVQQTVDLYNCHLSQFKTTHQGQS